MKKVWSDIKIEALDINMTFSGTSNDTHEGARDKLGQYIGSVGGEIPLDSPVYVSLDEYMNIPFS